LNIDTILGEVTIRQRRKKLEEITRGNGLSDAYTATITRPKTQRGNKSVLGFKVLMWVLYSERPLRTEELRHALAVEVGSADLDSENIPALRTLIASCLGLVTVEASSSTVRLVHFTLQEHLLSSPTLFYSPHSTIAEACLTYLNYDYVKDISPTLGSAPSTMPLLEYASYYWGKHATSGMTENVKALALRLLDGFDEHISGQLLLLRYLWGGHHDLLPPNGVPKSTGFTGLHGVAFLGIVEIVAAVLDMREWDVNALDRTGQTALTWAARRGHAEVVKILLGREGLDPNHIRYGRTPLVSAVNYGHEEVVRVLLGREGVAPCQPFNGQTPLLRAVWCGHEGIVKALLERKDVDPNTARIPYGETPLMWAADRGNECVIKMLLEREDIIPDHTLCNQTPLHHAALHGHKGIVKMLLEREDVNPDRVDTEHGSTPLSLAARDGHEGVVRMLLERGGVNPNMPSAKYGVTAL